MRFKWPLKNTCFDINSYHRSPGSTNFFFTFPFTFLLLRKYSSTSSIPLDPSPLVSLQKHKNISSPSITTASIEKKNVVNEDPWDQFQVGDMVLLRDTTKNKTYLTGPLQPQSVFSNHKGDIRHEDIIGLKPRSLVQTHLQHSFRIHFPSLEEYVVMMPRTATPIYPKDASTVIQLLDLHPHHRILESGTGSGALSLYLARCLLPNKGKLVSIELRKNHSQQAQKWAQRYHRGEYKDRIDFWVGSLPLVLQEPTFRSTYAFSSFHGAVLDLLEPWSYFQDVIPFLKMDGTLVVYVPNITQAVQCQQYIYETRCPLVLEKCVEIIERPWELKRAMVKWPEKKNEKMIESMNPIAASTDYPIHIEMHKVENPLLHDIDLTRKNENENENEANNMNESTSDSTDSKSEILNTSFTSSTSTSTMLQNLNWICRPSHMPTGHTAFLLKFKRIAH